MYPLATPHRVKFVQFRFPLSDPQVTSFLPKIKRRCDAAVGASPASVTAVPLVLGAVGFTAAGVAAGSYAAGMMSATAVANGGAVAAGSAVAVLQSIGAAGLSGTASAAVASLGGTAGALLGLIL
uniref:Interferon alpha-inducible protein 27-like protein 2-like n=1 Tax=Scleropages formosus TaxID=113540 RepID=A0A8C9WCY0_SCLFO